MGKRTPIASIILVAILTVSAKSQTPSTDPALLQPGDPAVSTSVRKRAFTSPTESMKNAKTIFVESFSLLVGSSVVENKLKKRKEFQDLGLMITRDAGTADLILHVEHDLFTMYTYSV